MNSKSIRSFIGAKNFDLSREFYLELGFEERKIDSSMSLFLVNEKLGFYLQNAYVRDWVDNSMLFLEVEDIDDSFEKIKSLNLPSKFKNVRLTDIKHLDWGKEFFLHDPSGVLWHFGIFNT